MDHFYSVDPMWKRIHSRLCLVSGLESGNPSEDRVKIQELGADILESEMGADDGMGWRNNQPFLSRQDEVFPGPGRQRYENVRFRVVFERHQTVWNGRPVEDTVIAVQRFVPGGGSWTVQYSGVPHGAILDVKDGQTVVNGQRLWHMP